MPRIKKKLDRQLSRYLGLERENVDDEGLKAFVESVHKSYEQYEDKNKIATRNLEISSKELNEANNELADLNASVQAMLESLGQALFVFGQDGKCGPIYSDACLALFGSEPPEKYVWDVLDFNESTTKNFKSVVQFAFSNSSALPFEDIFEMAPAFYSDTDEKCITLNYKPIETLSGGLYAILVIGEDQTQARLDRKKLLEREVHTERILRLIHNRNDFIKAITDVQSYFLGEDPLYQYEEGIKPALYNLHSFKGAAGNFYLEAIVDYIHSLEDYAIYQAKTVDELKEKIGNELPEIEEKIDKAMTIGKEILGENFIESKDSVQVDYNELIRFYRLIEKDSDLAADYRKNLLSTPIQSSLEFYKDYLAQTAKILKKPEVYCTFEGENFNIIAGFYRDVFKTFCHIARNAVDHGIEDEETRYEREKPVNAHVKVITEVLPDEKHFVIKLSDDGGGIDVEKIKSKLQKQKIDVDGLDEEALLQKIFDDQFSTKAQVSHTSGRGVGLNAVKSEVEKLGGQIHVRTILGEGTDFIITLPFIESI